MIQTQPDFAALYGMASHLDAEDAQMRLCEHRLRQALNQATVIREVKKKHMEKPVNTLERYLSWR